MNGHTQYGIVLAAHVDDYNAGRIKKHELTRRDKEDDRMRHLTATNAHIGSAFLAYRHNAALLALIERIAKEEPLYDFVADVDGFRHTLWLIDGEADIATITHEFGKMDALYIRRRPPPFCRRRARLHRSCRGQSQSHRPRGVQLLLGRLLPRRATHHLDYNRVMSDLNGLSREEFPPPPSRTILKSATAAPKTSVPNTPTSLRSILAAVGIRSMPAPAPSIPKIPSGCSMSTFLRA